MAQGASGGGAHHRVVVRQQLLAICCRKRAAGAERIERGGPRHRRMFAVKHVAREVGDCLFGTIAIGEGDEGAAVLPALVARGLPGGNLLGRPFGGLLRVAARAHVRSVRRLGLQRIRLAEEVVAARIDQHVAELRHVAVHALRGIAALLVVVVLGRIELRLAQAGECIVARRAVALRAHGIAFGHQSPAMRLVAV